MTVVIGLVCSDGVIVASDSQGTSGNVATVSRKVHAVDGVPAIWTASGSVYVVEEVEHDLSQMVEDHLANDNPNKWKRAFREPDLDVLRNDIAGIFKGAMKRSYESIMPGFIPPPSPRGSTHPFATGFLLLGFGARGPYFLEIAEDGQLNWHTDRSFYSLGSAGEFATVAMALMNHYIEGPSVPIEVGKKLAFRTIETTCSVSAGHVSVPVQMAIADRNDAWILDERELDEIEESVRGWKELERNTLLVADQDVSAPDELPSMS